MSVQSIDTRSPEKPAEPGNTMRAALRRTYGSADVITVDRITRPRPEKGEVLIHVHAAGLDRALGT